MGSDLTTYASWFAVAMLAIGSLWDVTLTPFLGIPTFCTMLRRWNRPSNALLAFTVLGLAVYLGICARHKWNEGHLALCISLVVLWAHLWLLPWLPREWIEDVAKAFLAKVRNGGKVE